MKRIVFSLLFVAVAFTRKAVLEDDLDIDDINQYQGTPTNVKNVPSY